MNTTSVPPRAARGGIPRGLLATGPVILSYGFRPFFLGAAIWACLAMAAWILTLTGLVAVGGDYGATAWHGHEMLFGFASAVVAGFLLTAVPNWTGRLPVSGRPLLILFLTWFAGRLALAFPGTLGVLPSVAVESAFLPALLAVCVREIVAGRKWADLKVVGGLGLLTLANLCFHYETIAFGAPDRAPRLALAGLVMMIVIVGGRMLPSFTRNWLAKQGRTDFPVPYNRFDSGTILLTIPTLALWVIAPDNPVTAGAGLAAALLHAARLRRWRGWTTTREPLVLVLHLAYAFVPTGLLAIAASAMGLIDGTSAIHVLTIGTVTTMMLAVMTRATRGHTGRELTASRVTCVSYAAIFLCAFTRPLAGLLPEQASLIYEFSALLWMGGFLLFLGEYGPMLVARRKPAARAA